MNKSAGSSPRCIIIAGPNGAGKTTFAREFLSKEAGVVHFINPDLIASGLSPLRPELAALAAGRLFLRELDRLARARQDFAFESTLSGLTYMKRSMPRMFLFAKHAAEGKNCRLIRVVPRQHLDLTIEDSVESIV